MIVRKSLRGLYQLSLRGLLEHQGVLSTSAKALPKLTTCWCQHKLYSTSTLIRYEHIGIRTGFRQDVAVLEMMKKPVNNLTLGFLTELNHALDTVEQDITCRGLVITSSLPVFSAGFDMSELYQPNLERLESFWRNASNLIINILGSSKVIMAAMNGSALAGGCALCLGCDYRIMAEGDYYIGLPASRLGLAVPILVPLARYIIGSRQTDRLLQCGTTHTSREAYSMGLVDQIVPGDQVMDATFEQMERWLAIPDSGRQMTKKMLRQKLVDSLKRKQEDDIKDFAQLIMKEETQTILSNHIQMLKRKDR